MVVGICLQHVAIKFLSYNLFVVLLIKLIVNVTDWTFRLSS